MSEKIRFDEGETGFRAGLLVQTEMDSAVGHDGVGMTPGLADLGRREPQLDVEGERCRTSGVASDSSRNRPSTQVQLTPPTHTYFISV